MITWTRHQRAACVALRDQLGRRPWVTPALACSSVNSHTATIWVGVRRTFRPRCCLAFTSSDTERFTQCIFHS